MRLFRGSFHKRLTAILLLVALVPVLLFGTIIVNSSVRDTHASYQASSLSALKSLDRRLDDYIAQTEEALFFVLYDNQDSNNNEIDIYNSIQRQLLYIMFLRDEHESLLYYFPAREEVYIINYAGNLSYLNASDMEHTDWYRRAVETPETCVVLPQHHQTGYAERYQMNAKPTVFSVCRTFRLPTGGTSVLAINCKLTAVADICSAAENMEGESLTCLTADGGLLYSTDPSYAQEDRDDIYARIRAEGEREGSFVIQSATDRERYTVVYKISDDAELVSFKRIPNWALNQYVADSIQTMLVIMLMIMLCIIPLGALLAKTVTRPLSALGTAMQAFGQGDIARRVSVRSEDEIGRMAQSFNSMAEQIQKLINEQYALKLSGRTAQLYSLIAQINPHFINNVLQSIGSVALEKDAPEIYEATTILAKMLRYTIKGKDQVTLEEELENTSNYLFIQKFRFEDNLHYSFQVEEGLKAVVLPKLTLQPLVENAMIHGLEGKKGRGTIALRCFRTPAGQMCIQIADDGVGMDSEKLAEIRSKFRKNDEAIEISTSAIGLINVYQRLRIIYGEAFSLEIQSMVGAGTELTLLIPLPEED
ncbi:MAG: sensor histidine kinase [Pseudoflavonifractor sp.]